MTCQAQDSGADKTFPTIYLRLFEPAHHLGALLEIAVSFKAEPMALRRVTALLCSLTVRELTRAATARPSHLSR